MSAPTPTPLEFSPQERFLIEVTEEAIHDGRQLEQWCYSTDRAGKMKLFPLNLRRTYNLPNVAEGFLDKLAINGKQTTVMGCIQTVKWGRVDRPNARQLVREFVFREFLPRANWVYPDGYPGGFGLKMSLRRSSDGIYSRFPEAESAGCIDWRELQSKWDWVLLTVRIYDFVMSAGPFVKRFEEAACVAPNRHFVHTSENPFEISIGYPFVKFAPIPNFFGFGPGKFGVAVKMYSFQLSDSNELTCKMYFAAAPRCEKVLDFGKSIPDPVYGGASLLNKLTLGAYDPQPFHDKLDLFMASQHARVHQALMEGSQPVWVTYSQGGGS